MNKKYDAQILKEDPIIDELSKSYIHKAKNHNIPIETSEKTLKHTIDMDLRENIPPQLYSVVAELVKVLESLESGD